MKFTKYGLTAVLIVVMTSVLSIPTRAQSPADIVGTPIVVTANGLEIIQIDSDGNVVGSTVILEQFTIQDQGTADWTIALRQSLSLSPDRQKLAFTATQDDTNLTLFILDLETTMLSQYPLISRVEELIWSPDSRHILLDANISTTSDTLVFDLGSETFTTVIDTFDIGLMWLPDSERFLYLGPSPCGASCKADNDLYLGDRFGINTVNLSNLDTDTLGLPNPVTGAYLSFGTFTWSPDEQLIYGSLGQPEEFGRSEYLYSIDLAGNLTILADISAIYPASEIPSDIVRLFVNPDDDNIYMITQTQGVDNVRYRWSILRYNPAVGTLVVVYERDFINRDDVRFVSSLDISFDGHTVAIGGADQTRVEAGLLLVVDVVNGQALLDLGNISPVCNVHWVGNQKLVYSQSSDTVCLAFRINQAFDSLIGHDLQTQTSTIIIENPANAAYFISPRTPGRLANELPIAEAGPGQVIADSDNNGAALSL